MRAEAKMAAGLQRCLIFPPACRPSSRRTTCTLHPSTAIQRISGRRNGVRGRRPAKAHALTGSALTQSKREARTALAASSQTGCSLPQCAIVHIRACSLPPLPPYTQTPTTILLATQLKSRTRPSRLPGARRAAVAPLQLLHLQQTGRRALLTATQLICRAVLALASLHHVVA